MYGDFYNYFNFKGIYICDYKTFSTLVNVFKFYSIDEEEINCMAMKMDFQGCQKLPMLLLVVGAFNHRERNLGNHHLQLVQDSHRDLLL